MTRRVEIIYHNKIQLNDALVAKRKREEEKFVLSYASHLLTEVTSLNPLKSVSKDLDQQEQTTFQLLHTLYLESPKPLPRRQACFEALMGKFSLLSIKSHQYRNIIQVLDNLLLSSLSLTLTTNNQPQRTWPSELKSIFLHFLALCSWASD